MKKIKFLILFLFICLMKLHSQDTLRKDIKTLCGTDDRVVYSHPAVGRINIKPLGRVATGWILFDGRIVTNRHVVGGMKKGSSIEFNVPLSSNNCKLLGHPSKEHKYDIIIESIIKSTNNNLGNDWAIFSVKPNEITKQMPKEAQNSFFYVEQKDDVTEIELIGFGNSTECTKRYASQLSIGTVLGVDGTVIKHNADTEDGSSGSPIINTISGKVIGIHAKGTCKKLGYNCGTSTNNKDFWNALGASTNIVVEQKRESGSMLSGSTIKRWYNNNFQEYSIPAIFSTVIGKTEYLRGSDLLISNPNEKFINWNNDNTSIIQKEFLIGKSEQKEISQFQKSYSNIIITNNFVEIPTLNPSNDIIQFKDPWLIDYPDPNYGNNKRNRGMDALYKSRNSPFLPDYSTNYNGDIYKGVFLNQFVDENNPNKPYYSVKVPQTQTINLNGVNSKFYFQNWSATDATLKNPNSLETPVVFTADNAAVKANYKGTHLSNNANAFKNNGQRKIVRTPNGHLHMVYESMGKVWYEISKDNGATWELTGTLNNSINLGMEAKNPSIEYYWAPWFFSPDPIKITAIVYEGKNSDGTWSIKMECFKYNSGNNNYSSCGIAQKLSGNYSSLHNSTPTIAFGIKSTPSIMKHSFMACWKEPNGSLKYTYRTINSSDCNIESGGFVKTLSSSQIVSINSFSLTSTVDHGDMSSCNYYLALGYDKINMRIPSTNEVAIIKFKRNNYGTIDKWVDVSSLSGYSGTYTASTSPTIDMTFKWQNENNRERYNFPIAAWKAVKNNGTSNVYSVIFDENLNVVNKQSLGNNVDNIKVKGSKYLSEDAIVVWSENNGVSSKYSKINNNYYSSAYSLSNGSQYQVIANKEYNLFGGSNPSANNENKSYFLDTEITPYQIKESNLLFSIPSVITEDFTIPAGTHEVTHTITVNNGAALTLNPGANLIIKNNKSLIVKGSLNITGLEDNKAVIDLVSKSGSIEIKSTGKAEIEHAVIKRASRGLFVNSGYLNIAYSEILNCNYGIYFSSTDNNSQVSIASHNYIHNNSMSGITMYRSSPKIIWNNVEANGSFGLWIKNYSKPYLKNNLVKNHMSGNGIGIFVHNYSSINDISKWSPSQDKNVVKNNKYGVYLYYHSDADLGYVQSAETIFNGFNSFYDNTKNDFYVKNYCNANAFKCYWKVLPPRTAVGSNSNILTYLPLTSDPNAGRDNLSKSTFLTDKKNTANKNVNMFEIPEIKDAYKAMVEGEYSKAKSLFENYVNNNPNGEFTSFALRKIDNLGSKVEGKDRAANNIQKYKQFEKKIKVRTEQYLTCKFLETENFIKAKDYKSALKIVSKLSKEYERENILLPSILFYEIEILNDFMKEEEKAKKVLTKLIKEFPKSIETYDACLKLGVEPPFRLGDNIALLKQSMDDQIQMKEEVITKYSLAQNYPNPFNPITNIVYALPEDGYVELKVFDMLGEEVANLVDEYKTAGRYNVTFDGSKLSSGIYFYQIKVNNFIDSKKIILMK